MLWRCWLGVRQGIQAVKTWVMRCWHGYLSGTKCKWFAYGPADATATPSSLLQKIQNGLSFWYQPTQIVLEKKAVKWLCVCVTAVQKLWKSNMFFQSYDHKMYCHVFWLTVRISVLCNQSSIQNCCRLGRRRTFEIFWAVFQAGCPSCHLMNSIKPLITKRMKTSLQHQ